MRGTDFVALALQISEATLAKTLATIEAHLRAATVGDRRRLLRHTLTRRWYELSAREGSL